MKRDHPRKKPSPEPADSKKAKPVPPKAPARKFGLGSLVRIGLGLVLAFVLLLAAAGIVLEYYFPSETLTPIARRELSRVLKMPVDIERIDLSLLRGVRVNELALGKDASFLTIHSVVLDYNLTQLMQGKLVINQVIVDRPSVNAILKNGIWNFQPLLELGGAGQPSPEKEKQPATVPPIPLAVDLKQLAVRNISLNLDMDGQTKARVNGLTLTAKGSAKLSGIDLQLNVSMTPPVEDGGHNIEFVSTQGQEIDFKTRASSDLNFSTRDLNRITLDGTFGFAQNVIRAGGDLPAMDVSGNLSLDAAVKKQELNLHSVRLNLGKQNGIELAGEVRGFLANPVFKLAVNNGSFDLGELAGAAASLLPPVKAKGRVKISGLQVSGRLPGFKLESIEVRGGNIVMENVSARDNRLGAQLDNMNLRLTLKEALLENAAPKSVDATVDVTIERGRFQEMEFSGLKKTVSLKAGGPNLSEVQVNVNANLKNIRYRHANLGSISFPLHTSVNADGDFLTGHIKSVKASLRLGQFMETAVDLSARNFGRNGFKGSHKMTLYLDQTLQLLPKSLMEKFKGLQVSGVVKTRNAIEGKLDAKFQPLKVKIQSGLDVQSMNVKLKEPDMDVQQFSTKVSLPVEYDAGRGIKLSGLNVTTKIQGINALGNWKVGPIDTQTKITMNKFYPLTGSPGILPIAVQTSFRAGTVTSASPPLEIRGLALSSSLKGDLHGTEGRNLSAKTQVGFDSVAALNRVTTGKAKTEITADVHDLSLARTRVSVKTQVDSPAFKEGDMELKLGRVVFESLSRQDLKNGKADIDLLRLDIPSLLHLNMKGHIENRGKTFDLSGKMEEVQLATLRGLVPKPVLEQLPPLDIAGTAGLQLTARGTLPENISPDSPALPVDIQTVLGLKKVSLSLPEVKGLNIKNLNGETRVGLKNNAVKVEGKFSMARLSVPDVLGEMALDPAFDFQYTLEGFDKLTVKRHRLTLPSGGLTHSLSGRVEGLKSFLTGKLKPTPAELTQKLDISLTTKNNVNLGKALAGIPTEDTNPLIMGGSINSQLKLDLTSGKHLAVNGAIEFNKVRTEIPQTVRAGEINGKFLFNKKLLLDEGLPPSASDGFAASRKGFFNQVREHSRHKNILRIDAVDVRGVRATGINLDLFFKNNQLAVEKFLFDLLGGSVAGNLFLEQTPEGPVLNFSTEFAALDFEHLAAKPSLLNTAEQVIGSVLGIRKEQEDEAKLDGNIKLSFKVNQGEETGKVNLDQIGANIAITRIGPELLDRALLFIDPGESKPAILETRLKLKLASPHRILIRVENGNLNVEAWLKNKLLGGIIKAPELKRVPISSLKNFDQISEKLQALSGLNKALRYLAAQGIVFEEDGTLRLF
ncbi:hypothetical protein UZ36_04365 [Candidatus Nitromaritima sp. SCGC AAA799-C22]|nr:hypothetical protein UZ36_04365 [Candidatus Nitromaritima sp. SCGC AAA799-C22]